MGRLNCFVAGALGRSRSRPLFQLGSSQAVETGYEVLFTSRGTRLKVAVMSEWKDFEPEAVGPVCPAGREGEGVICVLGHLFKAESWELIGECVKCKKGRAFDGRGC